MQSWITYQHDEDVPPWPRKWTIAVVITCCWSRFGFSTTCVWWRCQHPSCLSGRNTWGWRNIIQLLQLFVLEYMCYIQLRPPAYSSWPPVQHLLSFFLCLKLSFACRALWRPCRSPHHRSMISKPSYQCENPTNHLYQTSQPLVQLLKSSVLFLILTKPKHLWRLYMCLIRHLIRLQRLTCILRGVLLLKAQGQNHSDYSYFWPSRMQTKHLNLRSFRIG